MPDEYDDDADGDGIRNEMERAASSGTILYDPYNAASTPLDSDKDTLPDVLDDDNDNDGWPDDVELDRGSDVFDPESTPFNMYMGINSGFFYRGGLSGDSFSSEYDPESFEISSLPSARLSLRNWLSLSCLSRSICHFLCSS